MWPAKRQILGRKGVAHAELERESEQQVHAMDLFFEHSPATGGREQIDTERAAAVGERGLIPVVQLAAFDGRVEAREGGGVA